MLQIVNALIFIIILAYHAFLNYKMVHKNAVQTIQLLHQNVQHLTNTAPQNLNRTEAHVARQISQTSKTRVNRVYRCLQYNGYGVVDLVAVVLFVLGQGLQQNWLTWLAAILLLIGCFTLTYCLLLSEALASYLKGMSAHLKK